MNHSANYWNPKDAPKKNDIKAVKTITYSYTLKQPLIIWKNSIFTLDVIFIILNITIKLITILIYIFNQFL